MPPDFIYILKTNKLLLFIYLSTGISELLGAGSFLLPYGSWGLRPRGQAQQQVPLSSEPSHWFLKLFDVVLVIRAVELRH